MVRIGMSKKCCRCCALPAQALSTEYLAAEKIQRRAYPLPAAHAAGDARRHLGPEATALWPTPRSGGIHSRLAVEAARDGYKDAFPSQEPGSDYYSMHQGGGSMTKTRRDSARCVDVAFGGTPVNTISRVSGVRCTAPVSDFTPPGSILFLYVHVHCLSAQGSKLGIGSSVGSSPGLLFGVLPLSSRL